MPKILRIINRFNLGGPTFNVAYLTKYISSEYETLLIGGPEEDTEESSEFILQSVGFDGVNEWADELMQKMRADPMFRDVPATHSLKV